MQMSLNTAVRQPHTDRPALVPRVRAFEGFRKRSPWWWVGYVLLLIWSALVIFPIISMTLLGFRDTADIFADPTGLTGTWNFDNFAEAWQGSVGNAGMGLYFVNSAISAVVAIAVAVGFGAIAAYALVRKGGAVRVGVLRLFVGAYAVPLVVILIPVFSLLDTLGWLSNPAAIGVVYGALNLPLAVMVLHSTFLDFPVEIIEASKLDGLGEVSTFARIVAPLNTGAFAAVSVLVLVFAWGEAQLGIVALALPDSRTLAVGLLGFQGQYFSNQGVMFAGLAIATLPVVAAYLILQRFLVQGIALGGSGK